MHVEEYVALKYFAGRDDYFDFKNPFLRAWTSIGVVSGVTIALAFKISVDCWGDALDVDVQFRRLALARIAIVYARAKTRLLRNPGSQGKGFEKPCIAARQVVNVDVIIRIEVTCCHLQIA